MNQLPEDQQPHRLLPLAVVPEVNLEFPELPRVHLEPKQVKDLDPQEESLPAAELLPQ